MNGWRKSMHSRVNPHVVSADGSCAYIAALLLNICHNNKSSFTFFGRKCVYIITFCIYIKHGFHHISAEQL